MDWKEALSDITKNNLAIEKLGELLKKTPYETDALSSTYTLRGNIQNGQHLGWVGEMSDIGWKGAGCSPTYKTPTVEVSEKVWELGSWQAPLKWCYTELENTIAEYALKKGTPIGDLTNGEIWNILISEPMKAAFEKMWWRIIWFGDTTGANLTTGVDKTLFTVCDGLWKQLFAIATDNAAQKTAIAANAQTTTALQFSKLKEDNVAIGIFESLRENADSRVEGLDGAAIFCTKSLADALTKDLKREYKEILTWQQINGGMKTTEFDGVKINAIPTWDRLIMQYQNDGTKLNLPHRAFFGTPKQLFVGTPAGSVVSSLEVWMNQDERVTKAYSTGKIGTLVGEDDLFQVAY